MREIIKCPYCGAEIEVIQGVPIVSCSYCGTSIKVKTGERFKEHYLFRINYDYNSAYEKLIGLVSREVGSPKDLVVNSAPSGGTLHFIPLYVFHIDLRAMRGEQKVSEEVEDISVLASDKVFVPIPKGYRFPVRGRLYFSPRIVKRGIYLSPSISPEGVLMTTEIPFREKVVREAILETGSKNIEVVSNSKFTGLAHYPFWEIKYSYGNKEYTGYVDACDGTVVYAEHPKTLEIRVITSILTLLFSSALAGLLITLISSEILPLEGLIGGLLTSLPTLAIVLRRGIGEKGVYVLEVRKVGISEEVR